MARKPIAALVAGLIAAAGIIAAAADTKRVIWISRAPVEQLDLFWGIGAVGRVPKPPFTFVAEDTSGTKPKIQVKDQAGVTWTVKLPGLKPEQNEVHAEIAASRIVWALGYFADENYFVPTAKIEGVKDLKRAAAFVGPDGTIQTARFERMPEGAERFAEWNIEKNQFDGTKELSGLKMLMVLLGNWDLTTHNTWIQRVKTAGSPDVEERFLVTDLGSTFGRMTGGKNAAPSRWNLTEYRNAKVVSDVSAGHLVFKNPLMGNAPLKIPLEHARWFVSMASKLTDDQLRQAFTAGGASVSEAEGFAAEVRTRIDAIKTVLGKS